jgi:hypothetical protein
MPVVAGPSLLENGFIGDPRGGLESPRGPGVKGLAEDRAAAWGVDVQA